MMKVDFKIEPGKRFYTLKMTADGLKIELHYCKQAKIYIYGQGTKLAISYEDSDCISYNGNECYPGVIEIRSAFEKAIFDLESRMRAKK
jgi:hypothetical protein